MAQSLVASMAASMVVVSAVGMVAWMAESTAARSVVDSVARSAERWAHSTAVVKVDLWVVEKAVRLVAL